MMRYVNTLRLAPFSTNTKACFLFDDGIVAFRPEKLIISAERAPAWYDHPVARLLQRFVMVPKWRIERRFVMTKEAFAEVVYDELVGTSPSPEDLDELERQRLEGDLPDEGEEIDDESTTGTWIRRWVWNPYRPLALWASRADARKMGAALSDVWVKQITVAGEDQLVGDDALPAAMFTAASFGELDLGTARRGQSIEIWIQGTSAHPTTWTLLGLGDV